MFYCDLELYVKHPLGDIYTCTVGQCSSIKILFWINGLKAFNSLHNTSYNFIANW